MICSIKPREKSRSQYGTLREVAGFFCGVLLALSSGVSLAQKFPVPSLGRNCNVSYYSGVTGLILQEWQRIGGQSGPIGCPTGPFVNDSPQGGGYIPFEHGQIAISPDVWPNGVVAAYQDGTKIVVDWFVSWTDPSSHDYDKFIVRWDFNNGHDDDSDYGCPSDLGDGDQCDIIADMKGGNNVVLTAYHPDTHLRTKGTFILIPNHGNGVYRIVVEGCDESVLGGSSCDQGWMHSVALTYADPGAAVDMFRVDLNSVPSANDVPSSQAALRKREAEIVRYNACRLLPHSAYRNEEDYTTILLAKLLYADYFYEDHCPGISTTNREEASKSLLQQHVESATGTTIEDFPAFRTGEYDVALNAYVAAAYRFSNVLPTQVYSHLINELLSVRGPFGGEFSVMLGAIPIPESENHLNMIESARFLTNQLMFARTSNPDFDNTKNGVKRYWLSHLNKILKTDFIEYNARSYQSYTMRAIQNLYNYSTDPEVKTAAEMALNYVSAKLAVSSNQNRRAPPYRRKASYNSVNLIGFEADPQSGRMLALAGDLSILAQSGVPLAQSGANGFLGPWYGQSDMFLAVLSSYRIPPLILDLMLNRTHRNYFQGLHHYADEIYAASPSFLITAGGHYATYAYRVVGVLGKDDDIGLALPTTVMPTDWSLTRDNFIAFNGTDDNVKRSNMCVAPGFACGINPVMPGGMNWKVPGCSVQSGKWIFLNFNFPCRPAPNGLFAAFYQLDPIPFPLLGTLGSGFVEVFDTQVNPNVSFAEFQQRVLQNNGSGTFTQIGSNHYITVLGYEFDFELILDSRITKISNGPDMVQSTSDFARGTVIQSNGTSGFVTITNPYTGDRLTLDGRNPAHPVQTTGSVPPFTQDTCLPGFVWREADATDHVCVTAKQRTTTQDENSLAATRTTPGSNGVCIQGFVWREATSTDHVCVPSLSRDDAAWNNKLAPSRRAIY